jgi:hypothetical protein
VDQGLRRDPAETRIQRRRLRLKMTKSRAITMMTFLAILIGIVGSSGFAVFADSQKVLKVAPRPSVITKMQVVYVAPQMIPCLGGLGGLRRAIESKTSQRCIQISSSKNGPFNPASITGFSFKVRNKYKLLVRSRLDLGNFDLGIRYRLISVLEKTPVN